MNFEIGTHVKRRPIFSLIFFCLPACLPALLLTSCLDSASTTSGANPSAPDSPRAPGSSLDPHAKVHHKLIDLPSLGGRDVTVSGISSGGYMALQLFVSSSELFQGVASFAGGPYGCANGQTDFVTLFTDAKKSMVSYAQAMTTEKITSTPLLQSIEVCAQRPDLINTKELTDNARIYERAGQIDALSNLRGRKAFLFQGASDTVVLPSSVDKTDAFLKTFEVTTTVVKQAGMGHGMPTPNAELDCARSESPYLSRCNSSEGGAAVDGAGQALTALYGPLAARGAAEEGSLYRFSQSTVADTTGAVLDPEGFIYIPQACQSRSSGCRVHVALHGCLMAKELIDDQYARLAGYNEWAESNKIIIVYPNAKASLTIPIGTLPFDPSDRTPAQGVNPNGCWDWFGVTGGYFATKSAKQIRAITEMVNVVTQ